MNYYDYVSYKLKKDYINTNNFSETLPRNTIELKEAEQTESFIYIVDCIDEAIKNNGFIQYFQPQFKLENGKLLGVEVLLRLKTADGKFISPREFIPIAECTGQIYTIEQWVYNEALNTKKNWEEQGFDKYYFSINLSAKTLTSEKYFNELLDILRSYDINYEYIIIEITETDIIFDPDRAFKNVNILKDLGFNIALDDFGTGFSSLTYLDKLPIDIIKFDYSIIKKVPENDKTCFIIESLLELGHDLGFKAVAEGIERKNQLDYLSEIKCDIGQGFLLGKPMPQQEILSYR